MPEKSTKRFRCRGSRILGTACGNENNEDCERCEKANYAKKEKDAAKEAEKIRTKDLPADRVKRSQKVTIQK